MIKPTIGRKLWYWQSKSQFDRAREVEYDHSLLGISEQPEDATIVGVWNPTMLNLSVIDHYGLSRPLTSVPLIQEGDIVPSSSFATWMPYQVGQAKAHTAT